MKTKKAIQASFIKIYNKKSYDRMSIKEICLNAPVARTTFYEYYDNIAQLKEDIEDNLIHGILELDDNNCMTYADETDVTQYFANVLLYIKRNWDANYALLVAQPDYEYIEKWKSAIKYHLKLRFPDKTDIPNYNVIVEVIASGVIGAYVYWMKHPDEVDAVKICKISVKALNMLTDIM